MPVRKIPRNNRSVTGLHSSRKCVVRTESNHERNFYLVLDFDPEVVSLDEQPVEIEFHHPEGYISTYVPDVLVRYRAGHEPPACIYQVKPSKVLRKKQKEFEPKFAAAREYAEANGIGFEVVTEKTICKPLVDNARFLLRYRDIRPDAAICRAILAKLSEYGRIQSGRFKELMWPDEHERARQLRNLWHLIAIRAIDVDLRKPLLDNSVLKRSGLEPLFR